MTLKTYNARIQSSFFLTNERLKSALGAGYKILSLEAEKDLPEKNIVNVDSAVEAILSVGFKALARANHPDLGGDPEVMIILNRAKKELSDLLTSVR